jgi:hypothetical protein
MAAIYDITHHAALLDRINRDGAGSVVMRIAARTRRGASSRLREVLCGYEDMFSQLASRIRRHGRLQEEDYAVLKGLFEEIQAELADASAVEVPTKARDGHAEMTLRALHLLGGLEVQSDCGRASLFISPKMLTRALSVASLLDSRARAKHVEAIAKIRGEEKTTARAVEEEKCIVAPFAAELRKVLRDSRCMMPVPVPSDAMESMVVEYLPTSSDFYEAGIDYYASPNGCERQHYVLATTSGILLPQDYYGSTYFRKINRIPELARVCDKNPWRERYFRALADTRRGPRHYYFEIERARRAFGETLREIARCGSEGNYRQYIADSRKTIARFLRLPRFGLYGVDQFPHEFDHLTLGNGREMLLSFRDSDKRKAKIGHGVWVRPRGGTAADLRAVVEAFELRDMVAAALLGGTAFMFRYKTDHDVAVSLLEGFVASFVVPVAVALRQRASLKRVRDQVLEIGEHIKNSRLGERRFERPPNGSSLSEPKAMGLADEILSFLTPAKAASA